MVVHFGTIPDDDYHQFQRRVISAFRANDGCVGGRFDGKPLILLTTVGARTGLRRTSPLYCFDIDGRATVVATGLGGPGKPAWYHNIRHNPRVTVEVGNDAYDAIAAIATEPEHDHLLTRILALEPDIAGHCIQADPYPPIVTLAPIIRRRRSRDVR